MAKKKESIETDKLLYEEVRTKSRAGIEYVKYIPKVLPPPLGFNHSARRKLDAWARKHKYEPKT